MEHSPDAVVPSPPAWYRRPLVVAAAAVAIVALAAAAAFAAMQLLGARELAGPTALAARLPADTVVYVELDLEPEGSQGEALAALNERLAAFGAGEGAARLLDPLLDELTGGTYLYSRDVRPWFDGHVAFAVLDWGSLGQMPGLLPAPLPTDPVAPGTVLLMGVTDRGAASALTDRLRSEAEERGMGFVSRDRDGWTIWSAAANVAGSDGIAYAVGDDVLVVGTRAVDVEEILDLHAGEAETLADVSSFRDEAARLPGERIGTILTRPGSLAEGLLGSGLIGLEDSLTGDLIAGFLPLTQTGALVLADDRVIFERWQPDDGVVDQPAERTNDRLAAGFPADTVLYAELPEFGKVLSALGEAIAGDARRLGGEDAAAQVDQVETMLGRSLGEVGDWLGDLAIGMPLTDGLDIPALGLVGEATDEEDAADMFERLVGLLRLSGTPIVEDEIDGARLVRVDMPFLFGSIELEAMLDDGNLLLGTGGFVEWHSGATGSGLGGDGAYASALTEAGGPDNAGLVYFAFDRALQAIRDEPSLQPPGWLELEPRLGAVRDAIMATFVDGDRVRSRLEIRLSDP